MGIREGAGRVKGVDNSLTIPALAININPSNGSGKLEILFCQCTAHNLNVGLYCLFYQQIETRKL